MSLAAAHPTPAPRTDDAGPTDAALVERCRRSEPAAFEEIVERHERMVAGLAFRLLGWSGDVEDVTQDVFAVVLEKLSQFRGEAALGTWLASITVHACRRRRRRDALRLAWMRGPRARDQSSASSLWPTPAQSLEDRKGLDRLRAALTRLAARDREVLVLHYLQEMSTADLAAVLGVRPNTVDVRLHRARRRLRALLPELEA